MLKRIAMLFKGFMSLFVSGIERSNPEALLEAEKEELRANIAKYNQGLASHAALCEQLTATIKRQEGEEQDLRAKATANLRAGNKELAGQYALRLQTVSKDLADNRTQLSQSEQTYQELLKARDVSVSSARAKLDMLKRSIDDLKIQRAQAELTEMATGMISSIGGAGDTLNRLQESVEEERNKAAGRARVARDSIDTTEIKMKDAEQHALADQALADFAAREGIPMAKDEPATPAPTATKTMGPVPEAPQGS